MNKYIPLISEYKGKIGLMVGRFCDPSYDDIQLLFEDGKVIWFRFREVKPHNDQS